MIALLLAASVYVVDGDTLRLGNETIRLANVDAPESGSRARCPAERQLARLATERLRALTDGQRLDVRREGKDRYGRTLARVRVNGRDVGERLVLEGYAAPWRGRREAWCG